MLKRVTLFFCLFASFADLHTLHTMTETKTTHAAGQEAAKPLSMQEIATKTLQSPYKEELLTLFNGISTCTSKTKLLPKLMAAIEQHYKDLDHEKARELRYKNREKYAQAQAAFDKEHAKKDVDNSIERICSELNPYILPLSHAGEPIKFFMDDLIDLIAHGSKLTYHQCYDTGIGADGFDFKKGQFRKDSPKKACARVFFEIFYFSDLEKTYQGAYRGEQRGILRMQLEKDAFAYRAKEHTETAWREPYIYAYKHIYAQYKAYYNATGELPEEQYAPDAMLARLPGKAPVDTDASKDSKV